MIFGFHLCMKYIFYSRILEPRKIFKKQKIFFSSEQQPDAKRGNIRYFKVRNVYPNGFVIHLLSPHYFYSIQEICNFFYIRFKIL